MSGDIVLRLRSLDSARRAFRRGALRYAAIVLRERGYPGAAHELEQLAIPQPLTSFETSPL